MLLETCHNNINNDCFYKLAYLPLVRGIYTSAPDILLNTKEFKI